MIAGPDTTGASFVEAVRSKGSIEMALNLVVIRLLSIAVTLSRWQVSAPYAHGLVVPKHYREWPCVETGIDRSGAAGFQRFWVCEKAASVADDEPFPVGTTLVVERFSSAPMTGGVLQSLTVMAKISSIDGRGPGCLSREGWAYATYEAEPQAFGFHGAGHGSGRMSIVECMCGGQRRRPSGRDSGVGLR